jgi:hypothetical protein
MRGRRRRIARWSLVSCEACAVLCCPVLSCSDQASQWQSGSRAVLDHLGTGRVVSCSKQGRKRRVRVGCLADGVRRDQAMWSRREEVGIGEVLARSTVVG